MTLVVALTGSPSATSRTLLLAQHVERRLAAEGLSVRSINVRDLPAEDLLYGRGSSPEVREALGALEQAAGVVVATPIYKAAYTGILKCFLDVLPQFGLAGKVVLPLATGGTLAHVLAVDYALRPVLHSLGPRHVVSGLFVLDKLLTVTADGALEIDPDTRSRLDLLVGEFVRSLLVPRQTV